MRPRGFTLVELMVVIAIIGILASIIMVSLGGAKQKSRDAKRTADIKSIQLALSLYYNDNGMYPKNIYASSYGASAPLNGLSGGYLPTMPQDPSGAACNTGTGTGAGCYAYSTYALGSGGNCTSSNPPVMYHIGAAFEDTTNSILGTDLDAATTYFTSSPLTLFACTTGAPSAFDGNATNCSGTTAAGTDNCYDVRP